MQEDKKEIEDVIDTVTEDEDQDQEVAEAEELLDDDGEEEETAENDEASDEDVAEDESEAEENQEPLSLEPEDLRILEALLFASAEPLSKKELSERFPQERVKIIPEALKALQERYAPCGINLVEREGRWAFRTAVDLADTLKLEKEKHKKLSRAGQETLAVIAYHQPVTRAEIENIRGVSTSGGTIDALMEAGWIKPGKRREVPGRPLTWLTTKQFLDHFGLESLDALPGMDDLKAAGLLDKRPAIEAMPTSDDLFEDEDGSNAEAVHSDPDDDDFEEHYAPPEDEANADTETVEAQVDEDNAVENDEDKDGNSDNRKENVA